MAKKEDNQFELTAEEKQAIEFNRKENELLKQFKEGYEKLVQETGYRMVIDGNSPLNNLQLGIGKVNN